MFCPLQNIKISIQPVKMNKVAHSGYNSWSNLDYINVKLDDIILHLVAKRYFPHQV